MTRSSGILMPVFSLPSPHGTGTLGKAAYEFVDFLENAGQTWWQILPVCPPDHANSPYSSPSAYAGDPRLIDLDLLAESGLITGEEIREASADAPLDAPDRIDHAFIKRQRGQLLRKAFERGREADAGNVGKFAAENSRWLDDHALFMALKESFDDKPWQEWPDEDIRLHRSEAVGRYREQLAGEISYHIYVQYLFFRQWAALKEYASGKGVKILGDMPLYVAPDSADVWASAEDFILDERNVPVDVAGVPPDYFSKEGQLWGNPLYDYGHQEQEGFGWWIRRVDHLGKMYDAIRIDHFRGVESFWAIPAGERSAVKGRWVKGPGMKLLGVLTGWFPEISFVAEDLGILTSEVTVLREQAGLPGMKILEFAFDPESESSYLPHRFTDANCVCYTGTHDNDTVAGWLSSAGGAELKKAEDYLGLNEKEGPVWGVIRGGMSSVADLFIMQMQDCLELGSEARMNTPGTIGGNWEWRLLPGQLTEALAQKIAHMTKLYGRC